MRYEEKFSALNFAPEEENTLSTLGYNIKLNLLMAIIKLTRRETNYFQDKKLSKIPSEANLKCSEYLQNFSRRYSGS